jgi:uncharacterized protein (DUF362 family)
MKVLGLTSAGIFFTSSGLALPFKRGADSGQGRFLSQVSATQHDDYDPLVIKQKIGYLFDELGGIDDLVGPGDRVALKINLTGGAGFANHPNLQGVDIRECAWTHPEVLRAVGEVLIDYGVSPQDIYIIEALWDDECYNNFGYLEVQNYLGSQMVNLNQAAPYAGFANLSTGADPYFYSYFIMNQILGEVDALISIAKMKHHYDAGTTQSMKNLVGAVPLEFYQMPGVTGYRSAIHQEGGEVGYHLPRSICDINMARPVNLAVIDGIKNAVGGEGPWNPTFTPAEYGFLLAGKDPVAADSIAALIMGADPEAEQLELPNGMFCDNHLWLANQKGMGTNILEEIEVVGDGAGAILGVDEHGDFPGLAADLRIYPNFPNPFKEYTSIKYYIRYDGDVLLDVFDLSGRNVHTLVKGFQQGGEHLTLWSPGSLPPGVYLLRLSSGGKSVIRRVIYSKT